MSILPPCFSVDEKPDEKWLLFDSPVDTLWIESMNSVMDDNKVLTLINGERVSMPAQVGTRLIMRYLSDLCRTSMSSDLCRTSMSSDLCRTSMSSYC